MRTADIDWDKYDHHTRAMDKVLRLCSDLTKRFKNRRAPMPIVVLQAERPQERPGQPRAPESAGLKGHPVDAIIGVLHDIYKDGHLRCKRLPVKPGRRSARRRSPLPAPDGNRPRDCDDALEMVRILSTPGGWENARSSPYRPFSFPRSKLLDIIERAVSDSVPNSGQPGQGSGGHPDQEAAFSRLGRRRRPPEEPGKGALTALRELLVFSMPLISIVLTVELTELSTPVRAPWLLGIMVAVILVAWVVLLYQQSFTAPLSWVYPASPWFTTSTFIISGGDDSSSGEQISLWRRLTARWPRRVREERARMIIAQLAAAYYPPPDAADEPSLASAAECDERERGLQFYLSLRVHALLEDLRANYRPWCPDLRRRKRKWPPMVFMPAVDQEPGGVRFLQAISDLRSRRSEIDPLLILASSENELSAHPVTMPDESRRSSYQRWISKLRIEQSPSLGSLLPWVLLEPIRTSQLVSEGSVNPKHPQARWSPWNLWSRWTLVCAVVLLAIGGFWRSQVIAGEYCGGSLFGYDPNLVLVNGECIGTDTTSSTAFLPSGDGVTLAGTTPEPVTSPAPGLPTNFSQVSLGYLEGLIDTLNQQAASGPYVTFVYAGALTAPPGSADPLDAIEELAGVYAWQFFINDTQKQHVKIRIDIANDGDNSAQELRMAETVVAAAGQDPSIAGIIGLGVDTSQSAAAIQELEDADLPVVDTTNSDDNYPVDDWNYFGLSPTNAEEAQALIARFAGSGYGRKYAVIFERVGDNGQATDPYTLQQAESAQNALTSAGFNLAGGSPIPYTPQSDLTNNSGALRAICSVRPSVVYFAGRHEDMAQLVGLLDQHNACFAGSVTVLSGDDMTVTEYPGTTALPLASQMTLYYVAQTNPAHVGNDDNNSDLKGALQKAFNLGTVPDYSDPVFANGLLALGFDAADVLYNASTTDTELGEEALPRAAVAPGLRCPQEPVSDGATGPLGFADVRHGLDFFEAVNGSNLQNVTYHGHLRTVPGTCAPNVAP
jgi:hypothetical protein